MDKDVVLGVDIGGSHVSTALVRVDRGEVIEGSYYKEAVHSQGNGELIAVWFLLFISAGGATITSQGNIADTAKYATLNLYRPKNAVGGLVGYNIKLDDSTICKLKNGRKFSMRLYKEGIVKLWPNNEDTKISINVKFGEAYFVKFAMVSGLVGAHPELNLINEEQGRVEYDALKDKKEKKEASE